MKATDIIFEKLTVEEQENVRGGTDPVDPPVTDRPTDTCWP
jgi:hypothetical protein